MKGVAYHKVPDLTLSKVQREAMDCMISGMNDVEIAKKLGVCRQAIVMRIWRACDRLGALNRAQAAVLYVKMRNPQ